MKTCISLLIAGSFALAASAAWSQAPAATDTTSAQAKAAANAKKADELAKSQKAMQNSSSSTTPHASPKPSSVSTKPKPTGKQVADFANEKETFKGSKPVDKNATPDAPMKDVRKMTPEERAALRKDVVKESKP